MPFASQAIGTGSGSDSLGVIVGTWRDLHAELLATLIDHGPAASGVYARFDGPSGRSLELLNPGGHVVKTLGAGAGLVAATAQTSTGPAWLITGTDVAGVSAAAAALTPARLQRPLRGGGPGLDRPARAARGGVVIYRRRASPLHAARAGAGCAYCLALALAALLLSAPLALGAVVVSIAGAAVGAGVAREMRRAALLALPLGLLVMAVNMLVAQGGLTVIARLGDLPVFGQTDITLEATVYGAVLGVRAIALVLCGALYTVAVDPDEVLGLFRRLSFHSALTATLATGWFRCSRATRGGWPRRSAAVRARRRPVLQLMRAATSGVLDRALDVAAALEVRGYGAARRPRDRDARIRRPYSRHDIAFGASAVAIVALAIGARVAGLVPFSADPSLHAPVGAGAVAVAAAIVICALLPFADRRGIER